MGVGRRRSHAPPTGPGSRSGSSRVLSALVATQWVERNNRGLTFETRRDPEVIFPEVKAGPGNQRCDRLRDAE